MRRRWLPVIAFALTLSGPPGLAQPSFPQASKDLAAAGVRLATMRFMRPGRAQPLEAELKPCGQETGTDRAGAYALSRFKAAGDRLNAIQAELQLKRYAASGVTVGSLDYEGPALSDHNGVQLALQLEGYEKGMALHRYRPFWTGPTFTSDYRFLPDSNVLLLWKRQCDRRFHLLVPLAGDGMVGDVGVQNFKFGVAISSFAPNAPHHVPLFAYADGDDPYGLTKRVYATAFKSAGFYGRLRWEKPYPALYQSLGWCSWNAYYSVVTEQDLIRSARSLKAQHIPVRSMLIDDGWMTMDQKKLQGYEADARKFPHGFAWLTKQLHERYGIPHVGVWHAFQGYWAGVDASSSIARGHALYAAADAQSMPDPRHAAGTSFFDDWYRHLKGEGIDFVKVDNQAGNALFTDGLLPRFAAGEGSQRNVQEAARRHFERPDGLPLLNCMEQSLENVYNWRYSNVARSSNDYEPNDPATTQEHVFQNAYNSYWIANFAYPDFDMFVSRRPDAEYHAIARAMSGGPIYTADRPGEENARLLSRLAFSDGRLLTLDAPGAVTRDTLLVDTGLEACPLKMFGTIRRPGYRAGMVAAFNVNKSAAEVQGALLATDVEGLASSSQASVACYRHGSDQAEVLNAEHPKEALMLGPSATELFTLVPVTRGYAAFGLLDKYLGAADIISEHWSGSTVTTRLKEGGDFGAWCARRPKVVRVGDRALATSDYSFRLGFLRIPARAFERRTATLEVSW